MSKATKGTSTLFPQVSRGESNDAAKGLLDEAKDLLTKLGMPFAKK